MGSPLCHEGGLDASYPLGLLDEGDLLSLQRRVGTGYPLALLDEGSLFGFEPPRGYHPDAQPSERSANEGTTSGGENQGEGSVHSSGLLLWYG